MLMHVFIAEIIPLSLPFPFLLRYYQEGEMALTHSSIASKPFAMEN